MPGGGINGDIGCREAQDNFWVDYEWISPSRFGPSRPNYKPQYWDKIQDLDQWTNKYDPVMTCQPLGLPRQGTPRRIIQTDKDIIFFYGQYSDYGGGNTEFRDIPTDGRARTAEKSIEATYYGYSIGKWEGDTLVIDNTSFTDTTWLGRGGLFHSADMHIVERLTRVGNELHYDMTIEDPDSFIGASLGDADENPAARRRRRNYWRTRQLRSVRNRQNHHSVSALSGDESNQPSRTGATRRQPGISSSIAGACSPGAGNTQSADAGDLLPLLERRFLSARLQSKRGAKGQRPKHGNRPPHQHFREVGRG